MQGIKSMKSAKTAFNLVCVFRELYLVVCSCGSPGLSTWTILATRAQTPYSSLLGTQVITVYVFVYVSVSKTLLIEDENIVIIICLKKTSFQNLYFTTDILSETRQTLSGNPYCHGQRIFAICGSI